MIKTIVISERERQLGTPLRDILSVDYEIYDYKVVTSKYDQINRKWEVEIEYDEDKQLSI